MDSWPTDDRKSDTLRRAKDKGKEKEGNNNYTHFQQGLLSAVTLFGNNGRVEWTSLVNKHPKENLVAKGKFVNIFPATRPSPLRVPQATILQRAEQGANFLRTYFPDVDITAELVRDQIVADAVISDKLAAFNPYMGNLLEPICCHAEPSKWVAFLAFPMGPLNSDLNISPFVYGETHHTVFKPSRLSSRTFATPIQQIVSSGPPNASKKSSHLAIRTFGSTSFFEIRATASSSPSVRFIDIASVVSSDVGNRSVVDLRFSSPESDAVLVTDHGAVYQCGFFEGRKTLQLAYTSSAVAPEDFFWRVAPSECDSSCLLASDKLVQRLDFRTNNSALRLLSTQRSKDLVTSIEANQGDHLVRVATTSEVLWIDERFPRKSLLGCKHGREFDRYLEIKTISLHTPLTFLTSRRNGLMTVYDVCPSAVFGSQAPYMGYTFFRHPPNASKSEIGLFTLSERGSIHCLNLGMPTGGDSTLSEDVGQRFDWSNDVKELDLQAKDLRPDFGLLGAQDDTVDIYPTYDELLRICAEDTGSESENAREAFYNTLEKIPLFWQELNGSLEHMVTLFDIAFRSGEEPSHPSRADFLTQCALNSTRGYRAFVRGRLPSTALVKQSLWHYKTSPILKHFDTDISEDIQVTVDRLRRYDLTYPDRTEQSLRQESEAREELALDLGLSIDVFSPQPISKPAIDILSRAAEAMSLADEPPLIHFGYLRPISKRAADHYAKGDPEPGEASEAELTTPLGVRLLLKEWETGTNPRDYIYKDPYDDTSVPDILPRQRTTLRPPVAAQNLPITRSQRPPSIVTSQPPFVQPGRTTMTNIYDVPYGDSQQTAVGGPEISTQVPPGPYGGRPMGRKRQAKKRLDGF